MKNQQTQTKAPSRQSRLVVPGQQWRSTDPRNPGRVIEVTKREGSAVECVAVAPKGVAARRTRLSVSRVTKDVVPFETLRGYEFLGWASHALGQPIATTTKKRDQPKVSKGEVTNGRQRVRAAKSFADQQLEDDCNTALTPSKTKRADNGSRRPPAPSTRSKRDSGRARTSRAGAKRPKSKGAPRQADKAGERKRTTDMVARAKAASAKGAGR